MKIAAVSRIVTGAVMVLLAACASLPPGSPRPRPEAVAGQQSPARLAQLFDRHHVRDARYSRVKGMDFLQVDLAMRFEMNGYTRQTGLQDKRDFIIDFLERGQHLGDEVVAMTLPRLPPAALAAATGAPEYVLPAGDAAAVLAVYRESSAGLLAAESARVRALPSAPALDDYWRALAGRIEESVLTRGKTARMLLTAPAVPFVKLWIARHQATDYRGRETPDFAQEQIYYPAPEHHNPVQGPADDWSLLRHHAPVIVQGIAPGAAYPATVDGFGAVALTGVRLDEATPRVDSGRPTVYAYVDTKLVQGQRVKQLVYTLWYPAHPRLHAFDPEAGPIEGWTMRITLNRANQPVLFESVSNCGCYYKVFPTAELERRSAGAFPQVLAGKTFHVENHLAGKYDAVVPELVEGLDGAPQDVVLYYSAGRHQLVTVRPAAALHDAQQARTNVYALRPYEELEGLPFNGYAASLFGEDGLVRTADRLECDLLTPSGLYHAGHPRQRETQMIYFDAADFDDPQLLETYLRLPPMAFEPVQWSRNP